MIQWRQAKRSPTTGSVSPAHYGFWKALTGCFCVRHTALGRLPARTSAGGLFPARSVRSRRRPATARLIDRGSAGRGSPTTSRLRTASRLGRVRVPAIPVTREAATGKADGRPCRGRCRNKGGSEPRRLLRSAGWLRESWAGRTGCAGACGGRPTSPIPDSPREHGHFCTPPLRQGARRQSTGRRWGTDPDRSAVRKGVPPGGVAARARPLRTRARFTIASPALDSGGDSPGDKQACLGSFFSSS